MSRGLGDHRRQFPQWCVGTEQYHPIIPVQRRQGEQQQAHFVLFARQTGRQQFWSLPVVIEMVEARAQFVAQKHAKEMLLGDAAQPLGPTLAQIAQQRHDQPVGDDIHRIQRKHFVINFAQFAIIENGDGP